MIYVLDAVCGSGKSTVMINMIRERDEERWLFITPFLSEIEERLPRELPDSGFHTPSDERGSKLDDIRKLLKQGCNIASTHSLFKILDGECIDLILNKGYRIVIDEAVDAISEYKEGLTKTDIHAIVTGDFVTIDKEDRGRLVWNEEKYPEHDGKYADVRKVCGNSMLYVFEDKFLMCEYPPRLLANVEFCYVLTYMFKASSMKYWLGINDIEYRLIDKAAGGLRDEREILREVKNNLVFLSNRKLDKLQKAQRGSAFSKTWFTNVDRSLLGQYKAIMRSVLVHNKLSGRGTFWTTYKGYTHHLEPTGFKNNHYPLNLKATNELSNRTFCVYAANMFPNLVDGHYIGSLGGNVTEEEKDLFTLSNTIQFIFRGSIREGKQMQLLVMSKRVRKLLERWLDGGFIDV